MIKIKIDGQCAHKLNTPVIASGAVNFLFLEAQFSPEWDGLNKSYIFTNGDVCIQVESDQDKVAVPHEVLTEGEFTVGIKGTSTDGEKIAVKATHNLLRYPVLPCGSDGEPQNSGKKSATVTEQLRDMMQKGDLSFGALKSGDGESSALTEGCTAMSDYSVSLGDGNISGRKAYYIKSIDTAQFKIYLCQKQVTPVFSTADNTDESFPTPDFGSGDEFSIINGSHYILCNTISEAHNNVITYTLPLPFGDFTATPDADDYTLSVPSKPQIGSVTLGKSAFSAGEGNIAAGRSSIAVGRDNIAAGNFSAVFGRGNKAGYACLAAGFDNTVSEKGGFVQGYHNTVNGTTASAIGTQNSVKGDYTHVRGCANKVAGVSNNVNGQYNEVSGDDNTVGGNNNLVEGNIHDVNGRYNTVTGQRNTVRGYRNIASGTYQLITGQYNVDDAEKILIVGWGSSEATRKNMMTVDKKGDVYAVGDFITNGNFISPYSDDYLYTFDNYRRITKFITACRDVKLSCYERCMKVVSEGQDPALHHSFKYPLDGTVYPFIKLRYRMDGNLPSMHTAKIYFATRTSNYINEAKQITFAINPDNLWHEVILDMSQINGWNNSVTELRFDIPNTSDNGVAVYFKYIGLFHDRDEAESFDYSEDYTATLDPVFPFA